MRRGRDCPTRAIDSRQNSCGNGFDLDVHQDEPMLVVHMDEILNGIDIAERNRPVFAESLPII